MQHENEGANLAQPSPLPPDSSGSRRIDGDGNVDPEGDFNDYSNQDMSHHSNGNTDQDEEQLSPTPAEAARIVANRRAGSREHNTSSTD